MISSPCFALLLLKYVFLLPISMCFCCFVYFGCSLSFKTTYVVALVAFEGSGQWNSHVIVAYIRLEPYI